MKKLLSLVLSAAMVLTLCAVAFAASDDVDEWDQINEVDFAKTYKLSDSKIKLADNSGDSIGYGKTAYFPIIDIGREADTTVTPNITAIPAGPVTEYDVVKGIKPKISYEMNGSLIESVEIVKKKGDTSLSGDMADWNNIYAYYVAFKIKASSATSLVDVIGTIKMKKSGQVADSSELASDNGADFEFQVGYVKAYSATPADDKMDIIDDTYRVYEFDSNNNAYEDDEYEFDLGTDGDLGTFTVNTIGQGDLVLYVDSDFNSDVAALYPDANLDFFNGNGASFNKTGELYIDADEGTFLYQLKADGTLAAVKAEYDEYEEGFLVKTRTLGSYVISDVELDLAAAVVEPVDSTTPAETTNPTTGAAA